MPPKTPKELQAELEAQNQDEPAKTSQTAEGMEVPNPSRGKFFGNLEKVSKPD